MVEQEDVELTSPYKHIKNMEQFSLTINWRLAERLLHNQGCEKNPYGIG